LVVGVVVLIPAAPAEADTVAAVTDHLRRHAERNHIPGLAAAIVRDGQVIHTQTVGRDGDGAAVTAQTPVLLGSVSKPFTALAVMQLVEAGRVDLDAPAQKYLPWFRLHDGAAARVTVRHLLTHTSGLPEIATRGLTDRFDNSPGGLDRTVRDLAGLDDTTGPGSGHEYSDANYAVLGAIVAAVSGQPFGAYLREHVLDPLGMRRSAATAAEAADLGLPPGHRMWFGRPKAFDPPYDMSGVPYGYLAASVDDVARFVTAQWDGGGILSTESLDRMHTGRVDTHPGTYGFGWRDTAADDGTRLVWHAGATPGYFGHVVLMPATRTGVVVLSNVYSPALDPALASAAFDVATILRGGRPDPGEADGLFTIVLVALVVVAVALLGGIVRAVVARRTRAGIAWFLGCGALVAALLVGMPAAFGAGLRQVFLWTPDLGWTTVAVAALAGALGLIRAGRAVSGYVRRTTPPAEPAGRTATPAPDRTPADADGRPERPSPRPPR
jgi:CubicO group peptidase (beta-lactamase class C family)